MEENTGLTRGEVNRSLRGFIVASGFWGAWGQTVGIGTAIFTGYALLLGADEAYIALLTAVAYLLAVGQLVSPLLGKWIRDKKLFIIGMGFAEILFRGLIVAIPFLLAPSMHLSALLLVVSLGLLFGYAISPFYSTWIANTIPEAIRARFTSQQTIVSTVVAMVAGVTVGQIIDWFPVSHKQEGFTLLFAGATVFGWLGYVALARAPFPHSAARVASSGSLSMLLQPFRDTNFRRAVLFYGLWTFAIGVGGPFYSVFMLENLHISYTQISIYNALFMVTSIVGYRLWASLVDRFGGKPVLQILVVPATLMPLLWVFNKPDAHYLIPLAWTLSGVVFSGIMVSITPMLYELLPDDERRPFYLASWSAAVNLMGAMGPLLSGFLARYLRDVHIDDVFGFTIGHLQIIFVVSALLRFAPVFCLPFVRTTRAVSSLHLMSQMFRGNLLSYVYNAVVYNLAHAEERRAQATLALGKSGNPLAIEQLIQALADASPKVRRSAAQALGETGSEAALEPLVKELQDGASDIRSEAAEALGRLGHASSIDPLIEALDDEDPRVRMSAIRGLAEIEGEEIQELLFWHFSSRFEPLTFPTLVDVLSTRGDHRVIRPILQHLEEFRSPAIRLQLLNSVCRAMGAEGQFYRLLSVEDTKRIGELSRLLKRAGGVLTASPALEPTVRQELRQAFTRLLNAYERGNVDWMVESVRQIAGIVRDGLAAERQKAYEVLSVYIVILTLDHFLKSPAREELGAAQEIFLAVCLQRLGELVQNLDE